MFPRGSFYFLAPTRGLRVSHSSSFSVGKYVVRHLRQMPCDTFSWSSFAFCSGVFSHHAHAVVMFKVLLVECTCFLKGVLPISITFPSTEGNFERLTAIALGYGDEDADSDAFLALSAIHLPSFAKRSSHRS